MSLAATVRDAVAVNGMDTESERFNRALKACLWRCIEAGWSIRRIWVEDRAKPTAS